MGLKLGNKEISAMQLGQLIVSKICLGATKIWEAVESYIQNWSKDNLHSDVMTEHDFGEGAGPEKAIPVDIASQNTSLGNVNVVTKAAYIHEDTTSQNTSLGGVNIVTKAAYIHEDTTSQNTSLGNVTVTTKAAYIHEDVASQNTSLGNVIVEEST